MVSLRAYFPYFSYFLPVTTLKLQVLSISKIRNNVELLLVLDIFVSLGASETNADDTETDIQT